MNLRRAIEVAEHQRQPDPRLIQPRIERLPDGRTVVVIERISQMPLITGAALMAHLLRRALPFLAGLPQDDELQALRAEIASCLRQVAGT